VFSRSVCCLRRRCGAGNACSGAGIARPGAAACVGACSRLHALECPAPARVSLACLCTRADFVRPASRVIEHKALDVCVSGPCFWYALVYFCSRVDMLVGPHKRHPISSRHVLGFCMPARAHTGFGPNTHRGCIAGKSHCDTAPPTCALICHLVLPCATDVAHARHVRHSFCPAILLPQCCLPLHCCRLPHLPLPLALPNQKLRGLGDILKDSGLGKHSALWSGC